MTITTRAAKGSELSWSELDGNFDDLATRTGAGWQDIVSEFNVRSGPLSPNLVPFTGGISLYEFPAGSMREAFGNFHLPHGYVPGTMVYPHIHFSVLSNTAGVIRWGFESTQAPRYAAGQPNPSFPATSTIYMEVNVPAGSAGKHLVVEAPNLFGIDGTDLDVDAMILSRVFRDTPHANETFGYPAYAITMDMHIETNRASTPNRVFPFV